MKKTCYNVFCINHIDGLLTLQLSAEEVIETGVRQQHFRIRMRLWIQERPTTLKNRIPPNNRSGYR